MRAEATEPTVNYVIHLSKDEAAQLKQTVFQACSWDRYPITEAVYHALDRAGVV